jgi:beta-phosphoglucomutase
MAELRAVIFDFNGVLVDDEALHAQAFVQAMATVGVPLTHAAYVADYLALDDKGCMEAVLANFHKDLPPPEREALFHRKCDFYLDLLADAAPFYPGAIDVVRRWSETVPLAINSGALTHEIELLTGRAGIRDCFAAVVAADQVPRGKPDPIGYLTAFHRLRAALPQLADLAPAECVVIEDAPRGLQAARAAGMGCIGIATSRPATDLAAAAAVFGALADVDLAALRAAVSSP